MSNSYGKSNRPSGKPKTNPVYPYPAASETTNTGSDRRGKKAKAKDGCQNCGVYSQIANANKRKLGKNVSKEFNHGPYKGVK